jgi:hypothetical protein
MSHLRLVLTGYFQHYDNARPRRALGQLTPARAGTRPPDPVSLAEHWIRRKQVLGGLTGEYCIAALPPSVATESADHRPNRIPGPHRIGSCRRELLDRTLTWDQRHLMTVLREYEDFCNTHRPYRTLNQAAPLCPLPDDVTDLDHFRILRRDRAGGVIHEYRLVA